MKVSALSKPVREGLPAGLPNIIVAQCAKEAPWAVRVEGRAKKAEFGSFSLE